MYSNFLNNINIISDFIENHKNLIPRNSIFEDYYIHTYQPNNVVNKVSTFENITFSTFITRLKEYDLNHCIIRVYRKNENINQSNEIENVNQSENNEIENINQSDNSSEFSSKNEDNKKDSFITKYTQFSEIISKYLNKSESITFTLCFEQNLTIKRINKFYTKNFIDLLNLINVNTISKTDLNIDENKHTTLKTDLDINEKENDIYLLKNEIKELKEKLNEKEDKNKELNDKIKNLCITIDEIKLSKCDSENNYKQYLLENDNKISSLTNSLNLLNHKYSKLKHKYKELCIIQSSLNSKITNLQKENLSLKNDNDELYISLSGFI